MALIKTPTIVFLDEPTSGLDSAAADSIMKFLQDWAKEHKSIVVCTIHQPSSKVFNTFSATLLLAKGQVAFCGSPKAAVGWMHDVCKKPIDKSASDAEYVLGVVSEFVEDEANDALRC